MLEAPEVMRLCYLYARGSGWLLGSVFGISELRRHFRRHQLLRVWLSLLEMWRFWKCWR